MTRGGDIERLARTGRRVRAQHLDIRSLAASGDNARVAVVVAKYGHTAVARNTLKRQLRELVRVRLLRHVGPIDILVRAKREAYGAAFATLRAEIDAAAVSIREQAS